ncbi:hypothetical protein MVES1_002777 [Malassezia vespertilionis]|uniref:uncharacterized protein n=1 Tax=Malassezia vespertilionis TaxID=2020962 RepID=UPI0024B1FE84|nr:uncharacterized protein MVES1_002777 [Malassezia vespertilionis]WFD07413.1 hypothetical protein MVES1_002777 [Malassezia vespertilionis]
MSDRSSLLAAQTGSARRSKAHTYKALGIAQPALEDDAEHAFELEEQGTAVITPQMRTGSTPPVITAGFDPLTRTEIAWTSMAIMLVLLWAGIGVFLAVSHSTA